MTGRYGYKHCSLLLIFLSVPCSNGEWCILIKVYFILSFLERGFIGSKCERGLYEMGRKSLSTGGYRDGSPYCGSSTVMKSPEMRKGPWENDHKKGPIGKNIKSSTSPENNIKALKTSIQ